jgi:hypothetical protein
MNLNPFKLPTVAQQAASDLALAELELLKAHSTAEHAQAMLTYRSQQVARLRALVAAHAQASAEGPHGLTITLPVFDRMSSKVSP